MYIIVLLFVRTNGRIEGIWLDNMYKLNMLYASASRLLYFYRYE